MIKLFPGQQEDETICMVVREHWMVFFSRFVAWFMFVIIFFAVNAVINNYSSFLSPFASYISLVDDVYLMFLLLGLLIIWSIYYLNVQIITNERVVDIVQHSLLNRQISELHLSRLEDVTSDVNGFFQTFFNYGNVYVQTAGAMERFTFTRVPNPAAIEKVILDLYEKLPNEEKTFKSEFNK